ncbi:hypothetical protein BABL1_gene_695 [Candidatus Babela massiliensis]|uniref:Uncharacterized protein n=2 Tax=Candidatus Babela massiliensis TaxID=673862 RepID=V6DHA2_9BACT|nr:hypothetical protein BABL1_gene_695 [Candidatus Babela massiliensis]
MSINIFVMESNMINKYVTLILCLLLGFKSTSAMEHDDQNYELKDIKVKYHYQPKTLLTFCSEFVAKNNMSTDKLPQELRTLIEEIKNKNSIDIKKKVITLINYINSLIPTRPITIALLSTGSIQQSFWELKNLLDYF